MSVDPRLVPQASGPPEFQPSVRRQARATGAPIAVLILLAVLAAGVLLIEGVRDPAGLIIAVPLTAAAMAVVLACYFWLDRWEPEPSRLLLLAFLWGASVAIVVSLVLELASSEVLGTGVVLVLIGPAVEEAAKGAFLAVSRPERPARWRYPLIGYLAAVTLHALWNGSLTFGFAGYLLVYVVIMIPAFLAALLIARHHRRRERDVVRRQLPELVYYRLITPAEAGWLDSIAARRAWLRSVTARSGKEGAQALRNFQTAATELAFLRDRVQRGVGPADAYDLHAELVQALLVNRARAA